MRLRLQQLLAYLLVASLCSSVLMLMRWSSLQQVDVKNGRSADKPDHRKLHLDDGCRRIFQGDQNAIDAAVAASQLPEDFATDEQFARQTCHQLLHDFWKSDVSDLETRFPIAFAISVYKDFYQVRLLLQALHRDHNSYCIHVDSKSSGHFKEAVRRLAECLGNVRVTESSVKWGTFSVLEADMMCFRELLHNNRTWKYVINLTGQEFPIRTLKEMTQILMLMNGANHVQRVGTRGYLFDYPGIPDSRLAGLQWYKGAVHAIFSRPAVQYMLHDERAIIIYEHIRSNFWRKLMTYPDETYFATVNHNYDILRFPGSYTGEQVHNDDEYMYMERQIFRYKVWHFGVQSGCRSGRNVRNICILGVADLQHLNTAPHLIANKFHLSHQPEALRCLRARFWANTRADYSSGEYRKTAEVPMQYYRSLDFVQHHA